MRAHVCGIPAAGYRTEKLFSAVLHGPPGTGKTTLVEALAASCGVTLVEVTPSDIVIGGADLIERRTRTVFQALSLLTRAVILFDEFDPVLLRRNLDEKNPNLFSFLTPGMLPKLKSLHDWAEKRSVAYVLITNLIGKLDDAAIRNGRFDIRLGIYPPDFLSRIGRLYQAMAEFDASSRKGLPRPRRTAVREVVCATAGAPMNTLGKRGWYTAPEGVEQSSKNAFARLYGACDELADVPAEAKFETERPAQGPDAERELREWLWVRLWDDTARKCRTLSEAVAKAPTDAHLQEALESCKRGAPVMDQAK
jgi:SpoVK/Ycf46/Vps4 family AAA+-type ATPase